MLSEWNKNPEARDPMIDYHRPRSFSNFKLPCNLSHTDNRQQVVWTKDGQSIDEDIKARTILSTDEGRTLVFPNIIPILSGVYRCQIGNYDKMAIVDVRPENVEGKYVVYRAKSY